MPRNRIFRTDVKFSIKYYMRRIKISAKRLTRTLFLYIISVLFIVNDENNAKFEVKNAKRYST